MPLSKPLQHLDTLPELPSTMAEEAEASSSSRPTMAARSDLDEIRSRAFERFMMGEYSPEAFMDGLDFERHQRRVRGVSPKRAYIECTDRTADIVNSWGKVPSLAAQASVQAWDGPDGGGGGEGLQAVRRELDERHARLDEDERRAQASHVRAIVLHLKLLVAASCPRAVASKQTPRLYQLVRDAEARTEALKARWVDELWHIIHEFDAAEIRTLKSTPRKHQIEFGRRAFHTPKYRAMEQEVVFELSRIEEEARQAVAEEKKQQTSCAPIFGSSLPLEWL